MDIYYRHSEHNFRTRIYPHLLKSTELGIEGTAITYLYSAISFKLLKQSTRCCCGTQLNRSIGPIPVNRELRHDDFENVTSNDALRQPDGVWHDLSIL